MHAGTRTSAIPFYEKGNRQFAAGKYAAAEKSLRRAVKIDPEFGEAHNNLGNVLKEVGRYEAAANAYKEALRQFPDHPMVLNNLGNTLHFLSRSKEALRFLEKALELDPRYVDAHNNLGLVYRDQARHDKALSCFKSALAFDPASAVTHHNIALVWMDRVDFQRAREYLDKAIGLKPDFDDARINLSISLMHLGYHKQALDLVNGLLENSRRNCDALNALGRIRIDLGDTDGAIDAFRQSLKLKPQQQAVLVNLGNVYRVAGQRTEAAEQFRRALKLNPQDGGTLAALDEVAEEDGREKRVTAMEQILDTAGDEHPAVREATLFGLGRALEALGEPRRAMQSYLEANRIHRKLFPYSEESVRKSFAAIEHRFTPDFIATHEHAGCEDSRPIFIIGMPRSGTSLVEQILASHPSVFGGGELKTLGRLVHERWGESYAKGLKENEPNGFAELGAAYCRELALLAGSAPRITDKMPHNFLYLGLIRIALPNVRVIHCIRDPMDNCLSIFKNRFGQGHYYAYDLEELGRYYRLYEDLISHLKGVTGDFVMDLNYERLVTQQEDEMRRLLAFCDLEWDEACLSFHRNQRNVNTLSAMQVRRPIYGDSVGRWKRYEEELAPLAEIVAQDTL